MVDMPIHKDADGRTVASWEDPKVVDDVVARLREGKQGPLYLVGTKPSGERTTLYGFTRPERASGLHKTHVSAMRVVELPEGGVRSEVETFAIDDLAKDLRDGRLFIRDSEGHRLYTVHLFELKNQAREEDLEAAPAPGFR